LRGQAECRPRAQIREKTLVQRVRMRIDDHIQVRISTLRAPAGHLP
jgi:hypothetical protein